MAGLGGFIPGGLPMFDGSCFDDWKIKMRAVFGFQDVAEVIEVGVVDPGSKASDEEKRNYKHAEDG